MKNLRFAGQPAHPETGNLAASAVRQLMTAGHLVDVRAVGERELSGLVVPYGLEVGYTSAGAVTVPGPGRIQLPPADQLGRIKLVDEHRQPPVAIGYCTALNDTPDGLRATFYVGRTPDGERALVEATERVRDGFSVELVDVTINERGELTTARLSAVALVAVPAWASAREDGLAAAATNTPMEGTSMTEEQRARLAELLAISASDRTDEQNAELRQLVELAGGEAGVACTTEQPEGTESTEGQAAEQRQTVAAGAQSQLAASVPGSLPARGGQQRRPQRDIRELYAATSRVLSGRSRAELEAALLDVTSTANIWTSGSEYDGQLWSGLEYQRRWVPLMTPGELRSYKGTGWRWTTKPEVADYAGDKAAVPSNQPVTEEAAWTAARLAGAHDLDRKFFDFGDTEFIEAYYAAMRESYARQSDAKARAFLISTAVDAGAAGVGMFRAAAVAAQAVDDATGGASVDYFLVNSADRLALLDMTEADIPAYLEAFGVTPDKFIPTPGVPSLTVIAGNKASTKFRELPGSPIRVEAINIANGGVDGGVFGYYATSELVEGGVASATFTTA